MHRFFVAAEQIGEADITITAPEDVKHAAKVLRITEGEEVEICDGRGTEYRCTITDIQNDCLHARIEDKWSNVRESNVSVTLYQGMPKSDKLEWIIQKTTELGIARIVPVMMERCVVRVKNDKSLKKKLERWNRIAYEAAKQSKRGVIPTVEAPISMRDLLRETADQDLVLLPYEGEIATGMKETLRQRADCVKIGIVIGPEGGFEDDEVARLQDAGAHSVTLGRRILRTETAGIIATGIVQYELGDLGGETCKK